MTILFFGVFSPDSTNISQAEAFERAGCKVIRFPYRDHLTCLPERVSGVIGMADVVLFSKCNEVDSELVQWIKYSGTKTVLWYMDSMNNVCDSLAKKVALCDVSLFALNEPCRWASALGVGRSVFLPEGFDPKVDYPEDIPFERDIGFIGDLDSHTTHLGSKRRNYHRAIGFETIQGVYGHDHAVEVCKTRINLNFIHGGTSDRTYKVLAAGGFLLTEPWDEMPFIAGEHLDTFNSVESLKVKIAYWLKEPEDRIRAIAERGMVAVQKYSRDNWAKEIIDWIWNSPIC